MENSDYSDNCSGLKNCYLCFNTGDSEDSLYSIDMWNSDNCVDCLGIFACHDCYELLDSRNCYDTHFSFDIKNCHNSSYLYDCDGCSDCYGCFGLENKQFYIYNACYSEKEYHSRVSRIKTHTQKEQHDCVQIFLQQS